MAWTYLILASIFEIGWPVGLKISQQPGNSVAGVSIAVVCMIASGFFLWVAQRSIPIGTAYAVWTGIGAVGTFSVGIVFFGDAVNMLRIVSAAFIIAGSVGLKLAHGAV